MSAYLGDFATGVTLDKKFTTVNSTGTPTGLVGTPAISIYKDNSVTQFTTGVTLTTGFDSVVGLNNLRVAMTNTTNFTVGSNYQAILTAGTVGGVSVTGYVVAEWSINNRPVQQIASSVVTATVLSTTAANEVADAFLNRDMSTGTDSGSSTVRTPRQALRGIRNKTAISAGTLTVYKEDDSTSSWTAAVTTTAGDPISTVDPAGP